LLCLAQSLIPLEQVDQVAQVGLLVPTEQMVATQHLDLLLPRVEGEEVEESNLLVFLPFKTTASTLQVGMVVTLPQVESQERLQPW
jgi:hypothetical protein